MRSIAVVMVMTCLSMIIEGAQVSYADIPIHHCKKVSRPPRIDGRLNDEAWRTAVPIGPFLLHDGSGPASRRTDAKVCWDDRCLYVAFVCEDPDIWGTFTKRDDPIYTEEVVEVFLDPDLDLDHYYELEVSPRNVVFDALITSKGGKVIYADPAKWDCKGIRTAVVVEGTLDNRSDRDVRWTVEMAIPFASLDEAKNRPPSPKDVWGMNLYRIDLTPTPEFSCWSPTLSEPPSFHVPSRFGKIIFEE